MAQPIQHPPSPSKAAIRGHPIHPMLVPFPIALLALVPVTDILYIATGSYFWARCSYYLLWAGIVTAAVAAFAGLTDFWSIDRVRKHRAAWLHLGANVALSGLALVNVLLRTNDVTANIVPSGLILSLVGLMLLAVGGWYGGELAYRHKIGVIADEPTTTYASASRGEATASKAGP